LFLVHYSVSLINSPLIVTLDCADAIDFCCSLIAIARSIFVAS
jgi:hypothetical protein